MPNDNSQFYLIHVFGCVDPEVCDGPFSYLDDLVKKAREFYHSNDFKEARDMLFYLVIKNGEMPSVYPFAGGDLE